MSHRRAPQFSFIVPALNGEKTLVGTLRSIFRQNCCDFEVIVVDNGSTDNTGKIARSFPGVRYVFLPERGRSRARNKGASMARGAYLAFVDADVLLAPGWLDQARRFLGRVPVDALATHIEPYFENESVVDSYRLAFARWKSQGTFLSVMHNRRPIPLVNTAACIVHKRSFDRLRGFNPHLTRHEDLDFSQRLFRCGYLLGGTSAARAKVRYDPQPSLPVVRGVSYLRRSFEVQYSALTLKGAKFNSELLAALWKWKEPPSILAYAVLVELARGSARMARILSPKPRTANTGVFGKNLFSCSFTHKDCFYFLNKEVNFIFVDHNVYVLREGSAWKRLTTFSTRAVRNLCRGKVTGKEATHLLRLGFFSGVAIHPEESRFS